MTIKVFLRSENPAEQKPRHSSSTNLALLVLASFAARWTDASKTAIQLLTTETWKQAKDRCRNIRRSKCLIFTQDSGFDHPWSWRP